MKVSVVSVLLLLTAVTASLSLRKSSGQVLPLDMAFNSVDDSFDGCKEDMFNLVATKYTDYEKQHTPGFSAAWEKSHSLGYVKGKLNANQSAAIYLYTMHASFTPRCSYIQFNNACREGKQAYLSGNFQFYTLYYFLTEAVQALNPKRKFLPRKCVTVYRRTNENFLNVRKNQIIRFGSFTSTSLNKSLSYFGNVSCFEIKTCFGAKLGIYSASPSEDEVLIPPYEVFRVTDIKNKIKDKKLWCSFVYKLKSSGTKSALKFAKTRRVDQQ